MSERIEVGDLVAIVRVPSCGCTASLGKIFIVERISYERGCCAVCGFDREGYAAWHGDLCTEVYLLRRIPPLTEPERTTTTEELTA